MKKMTTKPILNRTTKGSTHVGGSMPNGSSQPPKKTVVTMPETTSTLRYSAKECDAKRAPPYSVMEPCTSSAAASTRSNGGRLVSAKDAVRKTRKPTSC